MRTKRNEKKNRKKIPLTNRRKMFGNGQNEPDEEKLFVGQIATHSNSNGNGTEIWQQRMAR